MTTGFIRAAFHPPFVAWKDEEEARREALELLRVVGLAGSAERWGSDLVWVECQLVQMARALISLPTLLLLDEPSAGMGAEESQTIGRLIRLVRERGVTILLISHDMRLITDVADNVTILNFGQKIYDGACRQAWNDPKVLEAYYGGKK
jgi:ABC-type branched-subunit amino acid transport system ATPase component